jgi:hypothetical protein
MSFVKHGSRLKKHFSEVGAAAEEIADHLNLLQSTKKTYGDSNSADIPKSYALSTFPNLIFFICVLLKIIWYIMRLHVGIICNWIIPCMY